MSYNFVADSFHTKFFLQQTFCKQSAILNGKRPFCVLSRFWGDLGATYDDHLRLIGKRVVDFILVLIELFRYMLRLMR